MQILDKANDCRINNDEHNIILAFLAAKLMFKNSQRSGPIENMTIKEFQARKEQEDGRLLIRVLRHKTAASTGPANLIASRNFEELLCRYFNTIRPNIIPKSKQLAERFFITYTGNAFCKVTKAIRKVAEEFSTCIPTASIHRKVTATTAHCDDSVIEGQIRSLNKHMSHSSATSSRYYQLPAAKRAVDAYNTIKDLSKRHFFTAQEDTIIKKEWPLHKEATPSLELCRHIVNVFKMQRTAKQLQDRWATLFKKHNNI